MFDMIQDTHLAATPEVGDLYYNTMHLHVVGGRSSLKEYLAELWDRRHFIIRDSRNKIIAQNSQTRLGMLWLVLRPTLDAFFFAVVFGLILQVSRGIENFVGWIIIGVMMFRFTSSAMTSSVRSIRAAKSMIQSFSFPRASIPISLVARDSITQLLVIAVMLLMILLIPPHATPGWMWLMIVPIFIAQVFFNLGLSFVFARLGFDLPDIGEAVSFFTRILMWTSAVIFPIERFVENQIITTIIQLNPVYMFLESYRVVLLQNSMPDPVMMLSIFAWSVGLVVVGFLYFWQAEECYAIDKQ